MVAISSEDSREYAEACFYRAYCEPAGSDGRIEWLCRSAIADAHAGTRDYAALMDLSRLLFGKGDVERSFRYAADHCMPDAIAFGGKLRPWQIARFFPEVESAYARASRSHERGMQVMIIIVSALLLLLLLVLFALVLRQRALRKAQISLEESYSALKESDNVKQAYIAQFLGQLSESIDTSRRYKNHVRKYLKMGNAKYLADVRVVKNKHTAYPPPQASKNIHLITALHYPFQFAPQSRAAEVPHLIHAVIVQLHDRVLTLLVDLLLVPRISLKLVEGFRAALMEEQQKYWGFTKPI